MDPAVEIDGGNTCAEQISKDIEEGTRVENDEQTGTTGDDKQEVRDRQEHTSDKGTEEQNKDATKDAVPVPITPEILTVVLKELKRPSSAEEIASCLKQKFPVARDNRQLFLELKDHLECACLTGLVAEADDLYWSEELACESTWESDLIFYWEMYEHINNERCRLLGDSRGRELQPEIRGDAEDCRNLITPEMLITVLRELNKPSSIAQIANYLKRMFTIARSYWQLFAELVYHLDCACKLGFIVEEFGLYRLRDGASMTDHTEDIDFSHYWEMYELKREHRNRRKRNRPALSGENNPDDADDEEDGHSARPVNLITPEMLMIALRNLNRPSSIAGIATYLKRNFPVSRDISQLFPEVVDHLESAYLAGFVVKEAGLYRLLDILDQMPLVEEKDLEYCLGMYEVLKQSRSSTRGNGSMRVAGPNVSGPAPQRPINPKLSRQGTTSDEHDRSRSRKR